MNLKQIEAFVRIANNKSFSQTAKEMYLTGGLCDCSYLKEVLGEKLHTDIRSAPDSRYAGAIGAALSSIK